MNRAAMYAQRQTAANSVLQFVVEAPPVPCARPRVVLRRGRVQAYNPDSTTQYKLLVKEIARGAAKQAGWRLDDEDYGIHLDIYRAAKRGDIDNFYKGIADALKGIIYKDDSQVAEILVRKRLDREHPRAHVIIYRLPAAETANDNMVPR